jgi:hypothetical protein
MRPKPKKKAPAPKRAAKAAPKAPKRAPKAPAKAEGRHPNDPALSALLGRLEALALQLEQAFKQGRSAHPNDPALSMLLGRLDAIEERLQNLNSRDVSAPRRAERAAAATPANAPVPVPAPVLASPADPDTAQFLARTPLFANHSAHECTVLAQYLEQTSLSAGSVLFKQGDYGDALYVVKSGSLEIYKNDVFGAVRVAEVRPGGLVGEMALVENKPRSANVRASEDSRLLLLSRASYAELKKAHPQVATKFQDELLLLLSTRLRQTTDKLVGR